MATSKREVVELKELIARIANAKGVEHGKMAKQVRDRIRGAIDSDTLVPAKHWPGYQKAGKVNRDSARYPAMPKATADAIFTAMTKGKPLAETLKVSKARTPRAKKADAAPAAPAPEATA